MRAFDLSGLDEVYEAYLDEQSRAPLYHATGPHGMLEILRSGLIKGSAGGRFVSTTRDPSLRYYWTDNYDDTSHAPFQIVLDAAALRTRFKMRPFDYAYADDGWGHVATPRREKEERVYASSIPFEPPYVRAVVFEPVTAAFLANANHLDDGYLTVDPQSRDATGIGKRVYYEVEHKARALGIPVIDRRPRTGRA